MRGRSRFVVAVAGALAAAYVVLAGVPWSGGAEVATVLDGYPQRIGFDRPAPLLPDRPGPMAATMRDNAFGVGRTVAVTAHGDLFTLPRGPDVLSADGRLLLTTDGALEQPTLVVHDLVTGERRPLAVRGPGKRPGDAPVPYGVDDRQLVQFSPDGGSVLGAFSRRAYGGTVQLLDLATAGLTDLGPGSPAGFLATGEAVAVRWDDPGTSVAVTVTDPTDHTATTTLLRLEQPWSGSVDAPPHASVSPSGTLALVEGTAGPGRRETLRIFDLADGTELAPRAFGSWDGCPPAWLDDAPVVPVAERGWGFSLEASALRVAAGGTQRLVAVHHRMQSSCLRLAADALATGPHRSLLGTTTAVWSWYVPHLALAAAVVLVVLGIALRHWRERGGRAPRLLRSRRARPMTSR